MTAIPAGIGTGLGSLPGTDPREAVAVMLGEVVDAAPLKNVKSSSPLPFLPELPARGVGADLIGRTAGLLVDLPVDYVHRTYRLSASATAETRRARDYLRWDLDALEEAWETRGLAGQVPLLKISASGPFTFAAQVELRGGHKLIRDRGAVRDVAASLAAGLTEQAAELERRLGVGVVVQLDEPSVGAVIDGTVPPLTRLDPIRAVPAPDVAELLESVATQVGRPMVLHSCARPRWELLRRLPSYALALDFTLLTENDYDPLGEALDARRTVFAGVVPTTDPELSRDQVTDEQSAALTSLIDSIGLPRTVLAEQVLITPTCGLGRATPSWARTALGITGTIAEAVTTL